MDHGEFGNKKKDEIKIKVTEMKILKGERADRARS